MFAPQAPTINHATSFKQLGSRDDHQLVKSLVEEVYQGCLEVGQCQFTAGKLRSLSDKVNDKLNVCIWVCRSAPAGNSSSGALDPSVRSSARLPSRIESVTMCSASQGCSARRGCSPSGVHQLPQWRRSPSRPRHQSESWGLTFLSRWHHSLHQRGAHDA